MPDVARLRRARLGVVGIFFLLGVIVLLVAVDCLPLAHSPWLLGLIAVFQGFGAGCTDVAMNNQAVVVERGYERPVMSALHAFFSVGGAVGAGLAALLQASHLALTPILAVFTLGGAIIAVVSLPAMLPGLPSVTPAGEHAAASLVYWVFATCMTIGRLLADRAVGQPGLRGATARVVQPRPRRRVRVSSPATGRRNRLIPKDCGRPGGQPHAARFPVAAGRVRSENPDLLARTDAAGSQPSLRCRFPGPGTAGR